MKKGLWVSGLAVVLAVLLTALLLTGTALAQEGTETAEEQPQTADDCLECHRFVSADVISSWQNQNHGRNGVGCPTCHATHVTEFNPEPKVELCMGCHDVDAIHPGFTPEDQAAECMECHAANVHLPPGEGSWLEAGLPPERLTEDPRPASTITEGQAQTAAVIMVILGLASGVILGLILDRFVRRL